jgi:Pyruvate/2-oxoacid:ferredoxin oxidoreductase delta subunit
VTLALQTGAELRVVAVADTAAAIAGGASLAMSYPAIVKYYTDAPKTVAPHPDVIRRQSTFDEVTQGLDESNALFEARRCLSCGNCFGCDNCYGVCPDNAVLKVDEADGYVFDLDYCMGCGICVQECPCGVIEMIPELGPGEPIGDRPAHHSADQRSGPEVGTQHWPHLSAEHWPGTEDRCALGHQALGVFGCLGVLNDPVGCAAVVQLMQVGDHPLEGPPPGAHAADWCYLRTESQDGLDLQRRPQHRLRRSDAPTAAQVLQRVQAEPDVKTLASAVDSVDHGVQRRPPLSDARGGQHETAEAASARLAIDDLHASWMPVVG